MADLSSISDWFWSSAAKISSRARQKGLQYAVEGYVKEVNILKDKTGITTIEAKVYRSQCKNDKPHDLFLRCNQHSLVDQSCSCTAGSPGYCSHVVGLMYTLDLENAKKDGESSTSQPQQWHKARGKKISGQPVFNLVVAKAKVSRKRKPVLCTYTHKKAVLGTGIYDLLREMSDVPISYLADRTAPMVEVRGKKYAMGSGLSHQLPLFSNNDLSFGNPGTCPVNTSDDFPHFPLPPQPMNACTVLDEQATQHYAALCITMPESIALERDTREQNISQLWFHARASRITSTSFKRICSRRADQENLVANLKSATKMQTKAMRRGVVLEPIAATQYTQLTGNSVYSCGFVVNPHSPHLGTSPDRKVIEIGEDNRPNYGLLEIKCPSKDSFTQCPYLAQQKDGTYKLKEGHEYYYQIMGQLGLTGMSWCDLFVKCENDYHLERIMFDVAKWGQIKDKLDVFYFQYYIAST